MRNSTVAVPNILKVQLFFALCFTCAQAQAQQSRFKSFIDLSCPEKFWVITHPFVAPLAFKMTLEAREETARAKEAQTFDKYENGGLLDAFRHAYWTALLASRIKEKKARSLGRAHEKGNYRDYRKGRFEEGAIPDSASCVMDLWNNEQGIIIGSMHKRAELQKIKEEVIKAIHEGRMIIIKRDSDGNFVNAAGAVIPPEQLLRWNNEKVLVPGFR